MTATAVSGAHAGGNRRIASSVWQKRGRRRRWEGYAEGRWGRERRERRVEDTARKRE